MRVMHHALMDACQLGSSRWVLPEGIQ